MNFFVVNLRIGNRYQIVNLRFGNGYQVVNLRFGNCYSCATHAAPIQVLALAFILVCVFVLVFVFALVSVVAIVPPLGCFNNGVDVHILTYILLLTSIRIRLRSGSVHCGRY